MKFISDFKYLFISSSIFILYSLDRYIPRGWDHYKDRWGVDQLFIENIAGKLVRGESLVGHLSHGIGYPLVIAPLMNIAANPLNIAGFIIFALTATIIFKNVDEVVKNKKLKLFIFLSIILSFTFSPDMKFWVIGASNTLSASLILLSVLWSISPSVPTSLPMILGLLSGLVFSARYVDYVFLIPIYFSALLNYSRIYKKNLLNNLIKSFSYSLIFIIPTFFIHKTILGDWFTTPYHGKGSDAMRLFKIENEASLSSRYYNWIIPNLYSTIVSYKSFASQLAAKSQPTALSISPILYLAPYSLCNFLLSAFDKPIINFSKQLNIAILCISSSLIIWTVFYASGWAYTAHDLLFQCLRYFMGWFSLIIFVSLFGLSIKPKIKTFFVSTIIYIILINYPSIYLNNQFKGIDVVDKIEVYKPGFKDLKKEYRLPIPFDFGKKSLLAISDNNVVLGVDNYSNQIFLGECNFKNLNAESFPDNFQNCKYYNSSQPYLAENGMEFLNLKKENNIYRIYYRIFENEISKIRNFEFNKNIIENIETKGSINLMKDNKNRFIIKNSNLSSYFLKRDKKNYLDNATNVYWPDWKIAAAEKIESKNQILTINEKNKIYCIWELDSKWNYKKDRLCGSFNGQGFGDHEKEFEIDINNDGLINKSSFEDIKRTTFSEISKFKFKVDPIKFEYNKFIVKPQKIKNNTGNSELNIKLINTGDLSTDTFPHIISTNCGIDLNSCKAYRTGRLNNLWRIWIKNNKSYEFLEFVTEFIKRKHSLFWQIQYVTLKS